MGDTRRPGSFLAVAAGKTTNCPLRIMSTNSSHRNSSDLSHDGWAPRSIAASTSSLDHGAVEKRTGTPLALYSFRIRRALCSTLSSEALATGHRVEGAGRCRAALPGQRLPQAQDGATRRVGGAASIGGRL